MKVINQTLLTELAKVINDSLLTAESNRRIELTFEGRGKVSLQRLEINESLKGPDKTFVFIGETYRTMFAILNGIIQGIILK